ncbi:hypothetical protein IP78_04865 [Brevundimonas sp. AAP58]|uniref:helix-turn-helix domain-containing protein n=1 Tax=Brevundimonas sp. AAP58 TaxID=1523422 RepID=UPI0006B8FB00|nr:transcriptional regulator [Brevundimonas sp. AAP58]KPF81638.1 hypothetical protein IP78_04865 [Brevundimonas sp. AAP58]
MGRRTGARGDRDRSVDDTVWIEASGSHARVLSPRRQEILDRLLAFGPLPVRTLAEHLHAQPSALYHHLRFLVAAGMVVEAGFRSVNRRRERLYGAPAQAVRLKLRPEDPDNRAAVQSVVRGFGRQMDRDFVLGQVNPSATTEGSDRNLGLRRICASPGPAALAQINQKLEEIDALMIAARGPADQAVVLTWTLAPLPPPLGETPDRDVLHPVAPKQRRRRS